MSNPTNHRKTWTEKEHQKIRDMAKEGKTAKQMAKVLKRTEAAVAKEASRNHISLD